MVLNYIELFLEPLRTDFIELLRNLSFAQGQHSFVLKVGTERDLDEALVGSHIENEVVVIELALEELVSTLVVEQRDI